MDRDRTFPPSDGASLSVHLLGTVDYACCQALQDRLVYEAGGRGDGHVALLMCEHLPLITLGRQASLRHVRWDSQERARHELDLRWVARGGGALVHGPGQLALYPIVPLAWHRWRVGDYLRRFQAGLLAALAELGAGGETLPDRFGIWGRSGQLAALGISVRHNVTLHGAVVNVDIKPYLLRAVQADPEDPRPMGSLAAERQRPPRMAAVREALFRQVAQSLDCQRVHVFCGHPLLPRGASLAEESQRRVG